MKKLAAFTAVVALAMLAAWPSAQAASSQERNQALTETFATKLDAVRPYPLNAMTDSQERSNLSERLLRMNNPNKPGYVALVAHTGQIIATFVIKGKVSSTASQLTNSQNTYNIRCGQTKNNDYCPIAVASMSDDGSYGPEEGGTSGVFFFTTSGVLIEWNGHWSYSDAPINLTSPAMVTLAADAQPSTNEHHLLGDGQQ